MTDDVLLEEVLQEARALSGGQHEVTASVDGPDIIGSAEEFCEEHQMIARQRQSKSKERWI